jgi:hypothetical protein
MPRIFQVEYMTRPAERGHIEQFDDLRKACRLAREMSDKHDSDAVVVALDDMPDEEPGMVATGHIELVFGMPREQVGTLAGLAYPTLAATAYKAA